MLKNNLLIFKLNNLLKKSSCDDYCDIKNHKIYTREFVKRYKEDNHKIRYLTKSEEEKLFNAIDELYPHIKPIIICALQTGMRKSEIFNLQLGLYIGFHAFSPSLLFSHSLIIS